ncbi:hypothetical protein BDF19DRAFT_486279 [Syncephalis fuscata]|nr:hypothetical protein BDF19DRAFT_486279 [Syncephalis fuscata]
MLHTSIASLASMLQSSPSPGRASTVVGTNAGFGVNVGCIVDFGLSVGIAFGAGGGGITGIGSIEDSGKHPSSLQFKLSSMFSGLFELLGTGVVGFQWGWLFKLNWFKYHRKSRKWIRIWIINRHIVSMGVGSTNGAVSIGVGFVLDKNGSSLSSTEGGIFTDGGLGGFGNNMPDPYGTLCLTEAGGGGCTGGGFTGGGFTGGGFTGGGFTGGGFTGGGFTGGGFTGGGFIGGGFTGGGNAKVQTPLAHTNPCCGNCNGGGAVGDTVVGGTVGGTVVGGGSTKMQTFLKHTNPSAHLSTQNSPNCDVGGGGGGCTVGGSTVGGCTGGGRTGGGFMGGGRTGDGYTGGGRTGDGYTGGGRTGDGYTGGGRTGGGNAKVQTPLVHTNPWSHCATQRSPSCGNCNGGDSYFCLHCPLIQIKPLEQVTVQPDWLPL